MRILVTAGNTQVPIDRVRCLTNIFTGRTGAEIAKSAYCRRHHVTLITSHPPEPFHWNLDTSRWNCLEYRTFDELEWLMAQHVAPGKTDVVIHCAAVADYLVAGVYAPGPGAEFHAASMQWRGNTTMVDRAAGKIKSEAPELWLRLVRAPKLVDKIRADWAFKGVLVKFKLEVGISDDALLVIAESSRRQSDADWMVANTLEGRSECAYLGNAKGYKKLARVDLPDALLDEIEREAPRA